MLNFIASWRREREAVRELSRLSDRELADLGIARSDIRAVAEFASREAAPRAARDETPPWRRPGAPTPAVPRGLTSIPPRDPRRRRPGGLGHHQGRHCVWAGLRTITPAPDPPARGVTTIGVIP